jgi:hypothetical protein
MMIYALVIIVVVAVLGFFLILPALSNVTALRAEVQELADRDINTRNVIAQTEQYQRMYDEAKVDYDTYKKLFYLPMDPEALDETITGMLVNHGLEPINLTMTPLGTETVSYFAPPPLVASAVPEKSTDGSLAVATDTAISGVDAALADSMGGMNTFVYTVDVNADGDRSELFDIIEFVRNTPSLEVLNYNYTDPTEEIIYGMFGEDPTTTRTAGSVSISFKVYVFIEGVSAQPQNIEAPTETPEETPAE